LRRSKKLFLRRLASRLLGVFFINETEEFADRPSIQIERF
jgi:hypothetical protein